MGRRGIDPATGTMPDPTELFAEGGRERWGEIASPMWFDWSASTKLSSSLPPELLLLRLRMPREPRERVDADSGRELEGDRDTSVLLSHRVKGIRKENWLPLSTFESTRNWPPSCSTIRATTANPRPELPSDQMIQCAQKNTHQDQLLDQIWRVPMIPPVQIPGRCSLICHWGCRNRYRPPIFRPPFV